jgi:hypothetical protein
MSRTYLKKSRKQPNQQKLPIIFSREASPVEMKVEAKKYDDL